MDETGDVIRPASPPGRSRTGAGCGSPWMTSRRRRCAPLSSGCTTTVWPTGTKRLINWCPGCRTSLSDLEVVARPETARSGHPLPPRSWRRHARTRTPSRSPRRGPRPSLVTPPSRSTRRRALPSPGRAECAHPVRGPGRARHRRRRGGAGFRHRCRQDHAGPRRDDFATGRRHGLPVIDVMTDDGRMNETAARIRGARPGRGARRDPGRPESRGDLEARGRTRWSSAIASGATTSWSHASRPSGSSDVRPMAGGHGGGPRGTHPHRATRFEKVFFQWMENIHDWNVSRQLWWGHRIPAWYCPDGHVTVSDARTDPTLCHLRAPGTELRQDPDIFDTWFSSGLWPFSTLGWPDAHAGPRALLPGHRHGDRLRHPLLLGRPDDDARRVAHRREPFGIVYLHGMVRDPYGAKMSKTTGNVVDPLGIIDEVGADALRFALVNGIAPGRRRGSASRSRAPATSQQALERHAFRAGCPTGGGARRRRPGAARCRRPGARRALDPGPLRGDHRAVDEAYATFQFGEATRLLYQAIWSEYCDWYLELAKARLVADGPPAQRAATWWTLAWVLDRYLRLLHPVMPHITEEIWGRLPNVSDDPDLLIVADWPTAERERSPSDGPTEAAVERSSSSCGHPERTGGRGHRGRLGPGGRPRPARSRGARRLHGPGDLVRRLARSRPERVHASTAGLAGVGEAALVVTALAGRRACAWLRRPGARASAPRAGAREGARQLAPPRPGSPTRLHVACAGGGGRWRPASARPAEQAATLAARLAATRWKEPGVGPRRTMVLAVATGALVRCEARSCRRPRRGRRPCRWIS